MVQFYAHTKSNPDGSRRPQSEWEPLFTEDCEALEGNNLSDEAANSKTLVCE